MSDVIISVEHLSKRYRLGEIGAVTLRESASVNIRVNPWLMFGRGGHGFTLMNTDQKNGTR
jgi:hypothetical protein